MQGHTQNNINMQDNKIGSDHKSTAYNSHPYINRRLNQVQAQCSK